MNESNKDKKVILFPGMMERNIEQAIAAAEKLQYAEAIQLLEDVLAFEDDNEYTLSIYIHCLYESKQFEQAKIACEKLIALQPENYFDVMELYLTICMQLKQFLQVEKIIHSLFEQQIIPQEKIEVFQRIQALNEEIAANKQKIEDQEYTTQSFEFSVEAFIEGTPLQQLIQIQQLSALNIRPFTSQLLEALEHEDIHPFVQSLILVLLVEQQISVEVTLTKFEHTKTFDVATIDLPTKLPQYGRIENILLQHFEYDPTKQELVAEMIAKHAIVCYPFEWEPFNDEEISEAYIQFIQEMFGDVVNEKSESFHFITLIEKLSELQ